MSISISADQLVAHRGHQHAFPENSLLSILDAIAAGARAIEFDVQLSQDGIPFLFHDETLSRVCGEAGEITALTAEQLSHCMVSEPKRLGKRFNQNPINTLGDLVPLIYQHKHIQFFLELKEESLECFGADNCFMALKRLFPIFPENVIFISFDLPAVRQAKEEGFLQTALVFRDWENRNTLLHTAQADYGFINYTRIPVKASIEADQPIIVYEVKHGITAKQLLERGASRVETFHIRTLLQNI